MLSSIPEYTTCPHCGTSIARRALERHICDERHRVDHVSRLVSAEAALFGLEYRRFLASPQGRFEQFYAARERGAG
jgi:hypothetical protein